MERQGFEAEGKMERPATERLVYDWNTAVERPPWVAHPPARLHDETLRDGIQSPSVRDPEIGAKLRVLHLLDRLGVETTDVGLPGAGPRAREHVTRLCREIVESKLSIRPTCAARTVVADIEPIVEISRQVGLPVEVMTFIGSSPIRQYAEGWSADLIVERSVQAISFAAREGLPVTFVTEDTVRSHPDFLRELFLCAIEAGATRLCLCDTVGHATPDGVRNLVRFTRDVIERSGRTVGIDWHGHDDRGLSLINALAAFEAGAERVHGTVLGIGERVGNTPLDLLLVNLKLLGAYGDRDLGALGDLCELVSEAMAVPIPVGYPVFGRDAFRTATGVHAAAIVKARRKGEDELADRVYSGVPAGWFGREQEILIGPMSGASNVVFWLQRRGIEPTEARVRRVLDAAKQSDHNLSEEEVRALLEEAE